MNADHFKRRTSVALLAVVLGVWNPAGWAQSGSSGGAGGASGTGSSGASGSSTGSASGGSSAANAPGDTVEQIKNATQVVKQMESDPQVQKLLQPVEKEAEVVTGGRMDGVDGITLFTGEIVAACSPRASRWPMTGLVADRCNPREWDL